MKKHTTVEQYFAAARWKSEITELRSILRSTALEETVKWGSPVYTLDGKNVVGLGSFQSYFGLWFFQGALLADKRKALVNAQAGRTKAMRQMRFHSKGEIDRKLVQAYVREAIDLARRGVEVKPDRGKRLTLPGALRAALGSHAKARAGFETLTPGKRREYADYVASAKRDETRRRRVDKILPMIASGAGLNDRYR